MADGIVIKQLELGPWDNFIYIIGDRDSGACAVVDPAWHAPTILKAVREMGFELGHILLTHSHVDHVNAVDPILEATDAQVHMLKEEVEWSGFTCENLRMSRPGGTLSLGKQLDIRMIHTPGHTPGSVCYLLSGPGVDQEILVAGDTLFVDGCGRCDFVGGDPKVMFGTLKTLTSSLPGHTLLYPGHNYGDTPTSSMAGQLQTNPFLQRATLADFVAHRMKDKTPGTVLPEPDPWSPESAGE